MVEFQGIEEVDQLADLGSLGDLHEVLLETVQGHLALVVDIDLDRLEHKKKTRKTNMSTKIEWHHNESNASNDGRFSEAKAELTLCMNFLATGRRSLGRVALNILTCFSRGADTNNFWACARKLRPVPDLALSWSEIMSST